MRVSKIDIRKFRGIENSTIVLPKHAVLIGDNNTGKTTILEALDLALGPDRLNRFPPIDEHDFYQGQYLAKVSKGDSEAEVDAGHDDPSADFQGRAADLALQCVLDVADRFIPLLHLGAPDRGGSDPHETLNFLT